jgi:hypothetical protein
LEKRPFSKTTIKEHLNKGGVQSPVVKSRLIASPMLNSKFSPSHAIGRSPVIQKKSVFLQNEVKKTVSPFINNPNFKLNPDENEKENKEEKSKVIVNRKTKNAFKNIESLDKQKFFEKNKDEDLPVTSCTYTGQIDDK